MHVVSATFSAFPCVATPSGKRYLRRDLSISCATDAYVNHAIIAALGIVIFVAGFPILFLALLKRAISENTFDARLTILHSAYKRAWWFSEGMICLEKLSITGVLV